MDYKNKELVHFYLDELTKEAKKRHAIALRFDPAILSKKYAYEKRNEEILGRIPQGRWGTPEDMAGPCIFLASEASSYMNGFTMAVDGGWLAR